MHKRISVMLLTGVSAALVIGLGAGPSFATTAGTWSVSPGGTVTAAQSGRFTLEDTTTGHSFVCGQTTGAAKFKSGSGLSGTDIGSITALSFGDCTGPSKFTFTLTPHNLPWALSADSYDRAITSGLTTGTVNGIHAFLSGTNCKATVDGTSGVADDGATQIHYHNSLDKLKIRTDDSSLHFYYVKGCQGLINNGDAVTFSSAYLLTPAQTITKS
jgi:hypothetical protein